MDVSIASIKEKYRNKGSQMGHTKKKNNNNNNKSNTNIINLKCLVKSFFFEFYVL
jgi:hypothetical protein